MPDAFRIVVDPRADGMIGEALLAFVAEKLGPKIQDNAKRTVPIDTGDLKNSIIVQVERTGDDVTLQVGVDLDAPGVKHPPTNYGRYVEEGTSKMAAQPYLRPAVYQARGAIL